MEKPLGILLDAVENELEGRVLESIRVRGIPPSLMEYVLAKVQCTVRELKIAEYTELIMQEDEQQEDGQQEEGAKDADL